MTAAPGVSAAAEGALTVLVVSIDDRRSGTISVRADCMLASDLHIGVPTSIRSNTCTCARNALEP